MDCKEAQQFAGDAIDGSLPNGVEEKLQAHLNKCKPCRGEVVLEKLSKDMVRQNVKQIPTPRNIRSSILKSLRLEFEQLEPDQESWLASLFPLRVVVPALAAGIVTTLFFLMVSTRVDPLYQMTAHSSSDDIIHQSFANFALLQAGIMLPAMVTTVPESMGDFFRKSDLQFGVDIPKLRNCDWSGGSASECSGVKRAHLFFKIGSESVYVFEVSDDDALYGTQISLPLAAKRALAQSGWYTDPSHPDCNVILWRTDEAVCVAVSTMKKEQLLALLPTR
ncbi:MAG: zf-HC2 domain-containing protein [Ignavibacteria bacterium]|nr:zf-HC2 domain-containing protein [Ignavibacteria bacterium]